MSEEIKRVIEFWFDGDSKKWWTKDEEFDSKIRETFGELVEKLRNEGVADWLFSAESCLAAIITLDQFSRNAFRNTPDMFSADELARGVSKHMIAKGFDLEMDPERRAFAYMPLMHSENRDDQMMSIACFERYQNEVGSEQSGSMLDYAHKHKDIVDRFGRYPHRNKILGRSSSEDEVDFLQGPGSSF